MIEETKDRALTGRGLEVVDKVYNLILLNVKGDSHPP